MVFKIDLYIELIIVVLFGELVIILILLFWSRMVGVIEFSMCLCGWILLVLLLIVLNIFIIFGLVLKLFILLFKINFVLEIIMLLLKFKFIVVVFVIVLFYLFRIEKCVVCLFLCKLGLMFLVVEMVFGWIVFVCLVR